MAYNQEEQEQLDAVKAWWDQYGKLVLLVIVGLLVAIAAYQGWQYYRHQRALGAATLYGELDEARQAKEQKKVREIARQIVDKYARTPYAPMAALAAAQAAVATGEADEAAQDLQWVIEHAGQEEMRAVARLRLSGVLLDQKRYEDALKALGTKPDNAFSALYADRRGDILLAQGKRAEARAAYQRALDVSGRTSEYRSVIQAKLDALGDAK